MDFIELRKKCLYLIKSHIEQRLTKADNTVDDMKTDDSSKKESLSNTLELRTAANTLRPLIKLVETEASTYAELNIFVY